MLNDADKLRQELKENKGNYTFGQRLMMKAKIVAAYFFFLILPMGIVKACMEQNKKSSQSQKFRY